MLKSFEDLPKKCGQEGADGGSQDALGELMLAKNPKMISKIEEKLEEFRHLKKERVARPF